MPKEIQLLKSVGFPSGSGDSLSHKRLLESARCFFPRANRLTTATEYADVFNARRSYQGHFFQLLIKPRADSESRLGLIVSKKVARQAPDRNYAKRVCREHFRQQKRTYSGYDIVLRLKQKITRHDKTAVQLELQDFGKRFHSAQPSYR